MCPYMAGGRSRRGSPKAGTTVSHKGNMIKLAILYVYNTCTAVCGSCVLT